MLTHIILNIFSHKLIKNMSIYSTKSFFTHYFDNKWLQAIHNLLSI